MAITEILRRALEAGVKPGAAATEASAAGPTSMLMQVSDGKRRTSLGTPPPSQLRAPPPKSTPPMKADPRTPGFGQPTPGTGGNDDFRRGQTVSRAVGVAGLINDLGSQQQFYRHLRTHMAFQAAGGEAGLARKVGPDATYLGPEPEIYDFLGNKGVRMTNGDEFWRIKIHGIRPKGFNVRARTIDGVRWYSVFEGPWTREWPGDKG